MNEELREELKRLKKYLPKGYRNTLAEEFEISINTVDKILGGKRNNIQVLQAAAQLAEEHKKNITEFIQQLKAV
jgi:hypothetical protein